MNSFDILVVILSITLAIFLVLAIVATVMFIQVLKKVRAAAETAKSVVANVESLTNNLKSAASTSVMGGLLAKVFHKFNKRG